MMHCSKVSEAGSVEDFGQRALSRGLRIKVVHCIDSFGAGGTELNMVRTIESLDQSLFELSVIVLNDRGPLRERLTNANIRIVSFGFPRLNSLLALRQAYELFRWLRRYQPDVLQTHDRYTNLFVAPCARLAGVKMVITSRRWWTAMPRLIYRIGNQLAYRLSHHVIANSSSVAQLMSSHEGVPSSRIVVLPNFVGEDAFEPMPEQVRQTALRGYGVPIDAIVVVAVAIFRPEKDLETLIEAIALLHARHKLLHLLLVGSGQCENTLRRHAVQRGVADRVHFPGFLRSPPNPHAFGDISVLCSLHEGFPNSIVEAMAAAKPVVATNVGGIPDAVEDGKTGFLVPPRSPDRLAAAIDRLVDDPALRTSFGEAGRRKSLQSYGKLAVIRQLSDVYVGRTGSQAVGTHRDP